jgi:hypothetical protein
MAQETNPTIPIHGVKLYFSDFFEVPPAELKRYGAFNVSLVSDLPLFIDPFLLFNSRRPEYRQLHQRIIDYLRFLKEKSTNQRLESGLIKALYRFSEVNQNWLGFTEKGNRGRGLGTKFAMSLHRNLGRLFTNFGAESLTKGSHLEKLCLIEAGVGRDNISDFTTNLIKEFLLEYTAQFTKEFVPRKLRRKFLVQKVHFNYRTETWQPRSFILPCFNQDFVLLTPKKILTRDQTWINREDLISDFESLCDAIENAELRAMVNNYLIKVLPEDPTSKQRHAAAGATIQKYPQLIDEFIRQKEKDGQQAESVSSSKVKSSEKLYLEQFGKLVEILEKRSKFYHVSGSTYAEALKRILFLKDVIENKGGHKLFHVNGEPLRRESDAHILYRFTWFASASDVSREVNDGRGPADYKISRGSKDKSIVEFKLASNPQLEKNLQHQTRIYQKASDANKSIKVILFFSESEHERVKAILRRPKLSGKESVVLIDARSDNKPSGSKAA